MDQKVAIVTGASSGIGRAVSELLASKGIFVIAVGRDVVSLDDVVGACNGSALGVVADVTDSQEGESVIKAADECGRLDILINAAGIIGNGSIENTAAADWDEMMDVNVRSVFLLTQKCVPLLKATRGSIVNISSVAGTRSFPNLLAYCVSKAAIDQLTRCAALDLAGYGIRVNAVNPGVVITNLHRRGGMSEDAYAAFIDNAQNTHPIGRAGTAAEVAELVVFLTSENAGWITGVTYAIDGGRALTCAR
jgi:NAD(P)-dependent dehydrogenase (short-subunit alcohol dehydrogenase family)